MVRRRGGNHARGGNRNHAVLRFRETQKRAGGSEKVSRVFVYCEMDRCHASGLGAVVHLHFATSFWEERLMAAAPPLSDFGRPAPAFDLVGTDNKRYTLDTVRGKNGLLVMFICNHCPYVKAVLDKL